jgi:hypothetical protein
VSDVKRPILTLKKKPVSALEQPKPIHTESKPIPVVPTPEPLVEQIEAPTRCVKLERIEGKKPKIKPAPPVKGKKPPPKKPKPQVKIAKIPKGLGKDGESLRTRLRYHRQVTTELVWQKHPIRVACLQKSLRKVERKILEVNSMVVSYDEANEQIITSVGCTVQEV